MSVNVSQKGVHLLWGTCILTSHRLSFSSQKTLLAHWWLSYLTCHALTPPQEVLPSITPWELLALPTTSPAHGQSDFRETIMVLPCGNVRVGADEMA